MVLHTIDNTLMTEYFLRMNFSTFLDYQFRFFYKLESP